MHNNWNVSATVIDTFIEEAYERYVHALIQTSSVETQALIFFAALSKLPEEVEHIWFKRFSLPTLLYIFARYTPLISVGLDCFIESTHLGRSCNIYATATNCITILTFIGTQGLLIARADSLCGGAGVLAVILASCFLAQLVVPLYILIRFPGCGTRFNAETKLIILGRNSVSIIMNVIIVGICIWKVWGTWKLKRQAGIQSRHSLVSIVLKQSIIRCCFVTSFSITHTILYAIDVHSPLPPFIPDDFEFLFNTLSVILVADFTLDLRRLNSAKTTASNISLPTLQFSNVLQHAHQSNLVEMSTPAEEEEGGDHDHGHDDILKSVNDMDIIQSIQESNV